MDGFATHAVSHTTALFRLPNHHNCLMLPPSPLRPAERSILFSEKSVRLSDDAQSAASSHAPKKGCSLREVWRSQTCTSGSPFFCFLFFGEAKKRKCPVGTRRMVKATLKANHKAATFFRLPIHSYSVNKYRQPENQTHLLFRQIISFYWID